MYCNIDVNVDSEQSLDLNCFFYWIQMLYLDEQYNRRGGKRWQNFLYRNILNHKIQNKYLETIFKILITIWSQNEFKWQQFIFNPKWIPIRIRMCSTDQIRMFQTYISRANNLNKSFWIYFLKSEFKTDSKMTLNYNESAFIEKWNWIHLNVKIKCKFKTKKKFIESGFT